MKWYAGTKLAKELTAHDHKYDIFHQHAVKKIQDLRAEIQDLRAEMQELNKTLGQLQNQVLTLRR
jgi:peptidoglycan hydrolase CwlO-like protein